MKHESEYTTVQNRWSGIWIAAPDYQHRYLIRQWIW